MFNTPPVGRSNSWRVNGNGSDDPQPMSAQDMGERDTRGRSPNLQSIINFPPTLSEEQVQVQFIVQMMLGPIASCGHPLCPFS